MNETYEQQMRDSDTIFTAVSTSAARDYKEAERMVVLFYVPSFEISRSGICHALKRLENFYKKERSNESPNHLPIIG